MGALENSTRGEGKEGGEKGREGGEKRGGEGGRERGGGGREGERWEERKNVSQS